MPDRALRLYIDDAGPEIPTRSENPQCPTGHYDINASTASLPPILRQKTPNARQGITTPDQATLLAWLGTVRKPQCPTGHYDCIDVPHGIHYQLRQKTPNARQGITTNSWLSPVLAGVFKSENPQCPTGHYD